MSTCFAPLGRFGCSPVLTVTFFLPVVISPISQAASGTAQSSTVWAVPSRHPSPSGGSSRPGPFLPAPYGPPSVAGRFTRPERRTRVPLRRAAAFLAGPWRAVNTLIAARLGSGRLPGRRKRPRGAGPAHQPWKEHHHDRTDPTNPSAALRLTLDYDTELDDPNDREGWRLVSFGRRHASYEHPEVYCAGLDAWGEPIPAHIGLRRRLGAGTAFWLSYFEHGLCRWSLMGEGTRCPWDSVRVAGILLWEGPVSGLPTGYCNREADARRFLLSYTAWANGEVYRYRLEDAAGEIIDACGGFEDAAAMCDEVRDLIGGREVVIEGDASWLTTYHDVCTGAVD